MGAPLRHRVSLGGDLTKPRSLLRTSQLASHHSQFGAPEGYVVSGGFCLDEAKSLMGFHLDEAKSLVNEPLDKAVNEPQKC